VAVLSALVLQEKRASAPELTPTLAAACDAAGALALRVGAAQEAAGLPLNAEEYAQNALRFGLVEVVHAWACGAPFSVICTLTDVAEGTIVRAITRLDETCRELRAAARLCGDAALYAQMEAASALIKRDIVFASSLYVSKAV
jgi:antiviral helicase SKI2